MAWIAPIAGAAIGGMMASNSQQQTNQQNMELNSAQMMWQEDMMNTAHQREVEDLRKAGLNPILSGTGGQGARSGSSSMIPMQSNSQAFSNMGRDLGQAAYTAAQTDLANAQADQIKSKTLGGSSITTTDPDTGDSKTTYSGGQMAAMEASEIASRIGVNRQQADNLKALTTNFQAQLDGLKAASSSAQVTARYAESVARLQKHGLEISNILRQSELPEARATAKFFSNLGAAGTDNAKGLAQLGIQTLIQLFKK